MARMPHMIALTTRPLSVYKFYFVATLLLFKIERHRLTLEFKGKLYATLLISHSFQMAEKPRCSNAPIESRLYDIDHAILRTHINVASIKA